MKTSKDIRITGLFLMIIGGAVSYWQIVKPILDALSLKDRVVYHDEGALLGSLAFLLGLMMALFGEKAGNFKPTNLNIAILIIGILLYSFGCIAGMQFILKALGYY